MQIKGLGGYSLKDRFNITIVTLITILLVGSFVVYSGLVDSRLSAKGMYDKST